LRDYANIIEQMYVHDICAMVWEILRLRRCKVMIINSAFRSCKSSGPRSGAGKNRSSRNAYRHGLTASIPSTAASAKQLDKLAREIAGNTEDPILLERARTIAQAELDLARVRRAKVALIECACAFGKLDPPRVLSSVTRIVRLLNTIDRGRPILPRAIDSSATMPSQ